MTSGKHEEFLARLDAHKKILFKIANGYTRNATDREDLVQEIIAQLWRSYERFDEHRSFSTWMYRVALNVAISYYRDDARRRERFVPSDPSMLDIPADESPGTDDRIATVKQFIDGLDELNRALMILYLDDLRYETIATILGLSVTNVATKLNRIKNRLRNNVASETLKKA